MNSRTNIDPVKAKAKRIKCEKEHLFFTRAFFLPRMGFKFSVNWHHEYIAWAIDEVINLLLFANLLYMAVLSMPEWLKSLVHKRLSGKFSG